MSPVGQTITVTVPQNTDLKTLAPTINFSGKSVSPASGAVQPFFTASGFSPVTYTVTAEDGSTASWIVTVKWEPLAFGGIAAHLSNPPQYAGTGAASDPIILSVEIDLTNGTTGWTALLTAIGTQYVALDLSASDMGTGVTEFDPGTGTAGVDKIVSLILPDTATSVKADNSYGNNPTFHHFSVLESVAGSKVETIGISAFQYCISLATISLPSATTIDISAFQSCTSLATVSLPSATTIGTNAFQQCTSLATVSLPSATTIGTSAFQSCTSLATVSLPSATNIGNYAFYGCINLTEISLPSVINIGNYAFESIGTTAPLTVTLGSTVPELGINLFNLVTSGTKTVTVQVPSDASATDWNGKTGTFTTDTTTENWGNAFRGLGWNGLAYQSGIVNGNISLTIKTP